MTCPRLVGRTVAVAAATLVMSGSAASQVVQTVTFAFDTTTKPTSIASCQSVAATVGPNPGTPDLLTLTFTDAKSKLAIAVAPVAFAVLVGKDQAHVMQIADVSVGRSGFQQASSDQPSLTGDSLYYAAPAGGKTTPCGVAFKAPPGANGYVDRLYYDSVDALIRLALHDPKRIPHAHVNGPVRDQKLTFSYWSYYLLPNGKLLYPLNRVTEQDRINFYVYESANMVVHTRVILCPNANLNRVLGSAIDLTTLAQQASAAPTKPSNPTAAPTLSTDVANAAVAGLSSDASSIVKVMPGPVATLPQRIAPHLSPGVNPVTAAAQLMNSPLSVLVSKGDVGDSVTPILEIASLRCADSAIVQIAVATRASDNQIKLDSSTVTIYIEDLYRYTIDVLGGYDSGHPSKVGLATRATAAGTGTEQYIHTTSALNGPSALLAFGVHPCGLSATTIHPMFTTWLDAVCIVMSPTLGIDVGNLGKRFSLTFAPLTLYGVGLDVGASITQTIRLPKNFNNSDAGLAEGSTWTAPGPLPTESVWTTGGLGIFAGVNVSSAAVTALFKK